MAWWDKLGEGIRVVRAADAIAAEALFTIAVGRVLVTLLVGTITELVAATGATCNTQLLSNIDTGTDTDLCAVTNIDAYANGDVVGITGIPTDGLIPATTHGSIPGMTTNGVIVPIGTIDLVTEAVTGGIIAWTLFYRPIDLGANVVVA